MAHPARPLPRLLRAIELAPSLAADVPAWGVAALAGRLVEIAGGPAPATLTAAMALVRDAQRTGAPAAWVTTTASSFFPPDAAAVGIDLARLPVVRVPDARAVARAAERLVRSGAFGLVVGDLGAPPSAIRRPPPGSPAIPLPLQSRLLGLAQAHATAVVWLGGLGSLVSLRIVATRRRAGFDRFVVELRAVKDKRRPPGWTWTEECRGPAGLH